MSLFNKTLVFFCVIILAGFCFTVFEPGFHGADEPVYFAYTSSLVEDGDLNVVNQVHQPQDRFYVTQTFNLPALHNHGGVLAWIPFYLYAKALTPALQAAGFLKTLPADAFAAEKCALSFSSVLFGFGVLILTFLLARRFYSLRLSFFSVAAFFLGTPFFYYMLIEGGNANIIAAFFMVVSLIMMLSIDTTNRLYWFAYGILYSFCITVKVDLWFQSVLIGLYFIMMFKLRKMRVSVIGWFIAGIVPVLAMKLVNDFLKYGAWHSGEVGLINFKNNYFLEQLFSPYRGYFYSSPILLICIATGLIVTLALCARARTISRVSPIDRLCVILFLYICVKLLICSFRFAWGGGNAGARQLLVDFPVFVLLYGRAFSGKVSVVRYLLIPVSAVFIFWNLLTVSEYYSGVDMRNAPMAFNFLPDVLLPRLSRMRAVLSFFAVPRNLPLKTELLAPLIVIFTGIFFWVRHAVTAHRLASKRIVPAVVIVSLAYMFLAYAVITGMNLFSNSRNSLSLRQSGAYPRAMIVTPREYELAEIESCIQEMTEYFTLVKDPRRVQQQLELRKVMNGYP